MNKKFILFIFAALLSSFVAFMFMLRLSEEGVVNKKLARHRFVIKQANDYLGFNLVDPEQAPKSIHQDVMRGYCLMIDTARYAPNYVGNELSCSNCHFAAGDTLGGKNNGLSLVGVIDSYPSYSERDKKEITLADRIDNCFRRSLNGRKLPAEAQEMKDLIAYLNWISKEVVDIKNKPWMGLKLLKSQHQPNAEEGAKVYQRSCAMCHKDNGEGGGVIITEDKTIPPLWGPNSFNDGAGMSLLPKFASFVYTNMPYLDACLTEEEALDVAAFVLQQPRPHFQ